MKQPNIVFIVADQWRYDSISYSGNEATHNPNLDALANDGVAFEQAFCQNPVCVPSRSSFLTGWYPHTNGHRTMHYLLDEKEPNILRTFKNNGYHVYWGGRSDFHKPEADQMSYCTTRHNAFAEMFSKMKKEGFKMPEREYPAFSHFSGIQNDRPSPDGEEFDAAIEFLQEKKYGEDPFFMYLAVALPHPEYVVAQKWYDEIDSEKVPAPIRLSEKQLDLKASILKGIRKNQEMYNWSDEELKDLKHVYYSMGTQLDSYVGKLVAQLKDDDIYDDTMIVFISDHGDYTGDYEIVEKNQNTFEDMLTRVPLIIKAPKNEKMVVRHTPAITELIDIQATFMDYANLTYDYDQFGRSLRDVIEGSDTHREYAFCEGGRLAHETQAMDAGHTPDNPYWPRTTEQEKMPQHTKAMMIRDDDYKYVYRLYELDEFYDLHKDPYETNNLIEHPEHQEKIQIMKDAMLKHFFETSDIVGKEIEKRV